MDFRFGGRLGGQVRFHIRFDTAETRQAIVVPFDDGRIEEFFAVRIGGGSGIDQPVLGIWGRCKMNRAVRSRTAGDDLGLSRMVRRVARARLLSW